jgi:hypothetical protein
MTVRVTYGCDGGCGQSQEETSPGVAPRGWFRVELELVPREEKRDAPPFLCTRKLHLCGQCAANQNLLDLARRARLEA